MIAQKSCMLEAASNSRKQCEDPQASLDPCFKAYGIFANQDGIHNKLDGKQIWVVANTR